MRVTIQVRSGPQEGRRYAVSTGQRLRFGRTEQADISFPEDDQMSSIHFQIAVDRAACRLTDLQSTNGSFVNDEQVESCVLRHHDVIRAGDTNFVTHLEGGVPDDVANNDTEAGKTMPAAEPVLVPKRTPSTSTDTFPLETCPSGLVRVTGTAQQIAPVELAKSLTSKIPMYLLVDPHRFDAGDEEIEGGELLLNWLAPEAAKQVSPVFLPANTKSLTYLEAGWGADAIIGIFSTCEQAELLAKLRELSKPREESEGMLGFCWPGIMTQLLNSQKDIGHKLTALASAFLVEDVDDPEKWQLLGGEAVTTLLDQVGLKHTPADPAEAETNT